MRTTPLRATRTSAAQNEGRERIFAELDRRAAEKHLDGRALAKRLGYTVSYIAKLRKGSARLDASPAFLRAVASFLGVPAFEVFVLAGFVEPKDFGPPASFDQYLDLHYSSMQQNPLIASMIPNLRDWGLIPVSGKLCIIGLYQAQLQLGEALAAQREEGALVSLKAMRAAVDNLIGSKAPNSKELRTLRAVRKPL